MMLDRITPEAVTIVEKCRYGRMLVLAKDQYMGKAFLRHGEYSESEVELWRQLLQPEAIVADIGANIGAHTVALASLVHRGLVFAFEPLPTMYRMMVANVAINGIANVIPFHAAIGAERGSITVPAIDFTSESNYGGISLGAWEKGNPVPLLRLDDVLPRLDFLKVDVEGMERAVLEGASRIIRESRPILYLEANPGPDQQPLIDYVAALGYEIWWHYAPHYNADNIRGAPAADEHEEEVVSYNILCLPTHPDNNIAGLPRAYPTPETTPPGGLENVEGEP